jgi:K+-transporting ATPase c subunit
MQTNKKQKWHFRTAITLTLLSLLICGIVFPLLVTGLAQIFFPNQANGEIVQLNGQPVGSNLIAQNFTLPIFFHPRNDSASGVDPDITIQDAYSQISRIQNATGIPIEALTQLDIWQPLRKRIASQLGACKSLSFGLQRISVTFDSQLGKGTPQRAKR